MIYLIIFLLGLAVGSFLNVVVYREINEIKGGWVFGRSFCPKCRQNIAWYDNIPLLSYFLLSGKCRRCKKPISFQYPLIELLTALEFVWLYWLLSRFSFFGQVEGFNSLALLGYWFFIFSVSLVIFLVDLKTQIIPDMVLLPAVAVSLLRLAFTGQWVFLFSGFAVGLFFLGLYVVTRGKGIGFGDVKLGFFIGLVLGWWQRVLVSIFLAFLTGAVIGVIVVIVKKKSLKSAIPFGPFLITAMWVAKIWGDIIWGWYWGMVK